MEHIIQNRLIAIHRLTDKILLSPLHILAIDRFFTVKDAITRCQFTAILPVFMAFEIKIYCVRSIFLDIQG